MNQTTVILIIALILLVVLAFWFMRWRFGKATNQVMDAFAQAGAFSAERARTREELGLKSAPFWQRMGVRDYKDVAFNGLVQAGVIMVEGDRYYLPRDKYEGYLSKKKSR